MILSNLTSPNYLQSLDKAYHQTIATLYKEQDSAPDPDANATNEQIPTDSKGFLRVKFPSDYQKQFEQYVTVDCPNSRIVRKMYVSPTALETLRASDTRTIPSGTVLVMETHSARLSSDGHLTPTRLNNIFIREKRDGWRGNDNSGEWRSAWYSPDGALVSSNQSSCIGCHAMVRNRDYLFTLPALLTAASTGQKQHQETEFGTSVCR